MMMTTMIWMMMMMMMMMNEYVLEWSEQNLFKHQGRDSIVTVNE